MESMWALPDPTTARQMISRLQPERVLAYSSVITTMDRLVHKGWLTRRTVGRARVYEPTCTRDEWAAGIMTEVLDDAENRGAALMHFVGHMDSVELETLRIALQNAGPGEA